MSQKKQRKKKVYRQGKNNTNTIHIGKMSLLETWKVKNSTAMKSLLDPKNSKTQQMKEQGEKIFWQKSMLLAGNQALNESIEQTQTPQPGQKSLLTYDCMMALSHVPLLSDPTKRLVLRGVPVTALLKDMLSMSASGQELSQLLMGKTEEECICLAVLPYHLACAVAPQAIGDIMSSCLAIFEEKAKNTDTFEQSLSQLRTNLLPYSIASHVDITQLSLEASGHSEDEDHDVGTGVILIVCVEDNPEIKVSLTPEQNEQTKKWVEEQGWKCLFGQGAFFPLATLEATIQHCQYEWGSSARSAGKLESVLFINNIHLTITSENKISLGAYIDKEFFGVSEMENVCGLWCLDLLLHDLEEKGIMIEDLTDQQN